MPACVRRSADQLQLDHASYVIPHRLQPMWDGQARRRAAVAQRRDKKHAAAVAHAELKKRFFFARSGAACMKKMYLAESRESPRY
jgi:hypothetical protein